jgi:hypothetical protein
VEATPHPALRATFSLKGRRGGDRGDGRVFSKIVDVGQPLIRRFAPPSPSREKR